MPDATLFFCSFACPMPPSLGHFFGRVPLHDPRLPSSRPTSRARRCVRRGGGRWRPGPEKDARRTRPRKTHTRVFIFFIGGADSLVVSRGTLPSVSPPLVAPIDGKALTGDTEGDDDDAGVKRTEDGAAPRPASRPSRPPSPRLACRTQAGPCEAPSARHHHRERQRRGPVRTAVLLRRGERRNTAGRARRAETDDDRLVRPAAARGGSNGSLAGRQRRRRLGSWIDPERLGR